MPYRLDRNRDADFLKDNPLDPVTYEQFQSDKEIIVCQDCGRVYLVSSWNYLNGVCVCGCKSQKEPSLLSEKILLNRNEQRVSPVQSGSRQKHRIVLHPI